LQKAGIQKGEKSLGIIGGRIQKVAKKVGGKREEE